MGCRASSCSTGSGHNSTTELNPILYSFGGGTGSGFAALLLERLSAEYSNKKCKLGRLAVKMTRTVG